MIERHPVLARQLRRLGIDPDGDAPVSAGDLRALLERVDTAFRDADVARARLERSIAISSKEIRELSLDMERSSESLLAHERDRLRLLFDTVTTGLLVIDRFGRITSVNPEAERLFGTAAELIDSYIEDTLMLVGRDGEPRPLVGRADLDRALRTGRWVRNDIHLADPRVPYQSVETTDGSVRPGVIAADVAIVSFRTGDAHLGGLVVVTDNAAREDARSKLAWQASHDALTGLPNRTMLAERIEVSLVQARRTAQWPSVLFIDLDRFKAVNDSLGHAAGDQLLVSAAERLQRCVRRGDTVARTGGDEFVVLCDGQTAAAVFRLAERIIDTLNAAFDVGGVEAFVSASIGIAHATSDDVAADVLLRDADLAMYRAKTSGGSRISVADDRLRSETAERVVLERALRTAVHTDELTVAYQPVFRFETGELVGYEALARWEHPTEGTIEADRFIGLAEESGVIVALGERVLDRACRDLATWNAHRRRSGVGGPLSVHVNISARELVSPQLPERVADAVRAHEVPAGALVLDIAEADLLRHADLATERLAQLDAAGVRVAIDDFGSEDTSLTALRRYPVHVVKIDRGLVAGIDASPRDERVAQAVIDLAHALGCQVLAEGVETEGELEVLRRLGCELVQGFLIGPPLSAADALALAATDLLDRRR